VIPEIKAVRDLCFFVEFLAELDGDLEKRAVRDKIYIDKTVAFHMCTFPIEPLPILRAGFI
jgi:hypothetical protein